jgi:hypothetical protein
MLAWVKDNIMNDETLMSSSLHKMEGMENEFYRKSIAQKRF